MGVSLQNNFLERLIFILSPDNLLTGTTTAPYFSFHLMAIVCVMANLLLNSNFALQLLPIRLSLLTNFPGGRSHLSLLSGPSLTPGISMELPIVHFKGSQVKVSKS